ncbi:MAG: hypothetical protein H7Z43_10210 [Clostridia bacterium]|nr:hypothetical protein [Deltaproteobacteria bacterium]
MRVAFFGQTGPYAPFALRELLKVPAKYTLALVVEGKRMSREEHRLRKPGQPVTGDTLAEIGLASGIPAITTTDVNNAKAVDMIGEHQIDLMVCVGFDRLFSRQLLATASRGGINAHPSDLPRLRGPAPIFWALKEGRKKHALCLHTLDPGEDHGDVLAKEWFVPSSLATGEQIFHMGGILAGRMLPPLLTAAIDNPINGTPQEHRCASRAPRPKPEDAYVESWRWSADALVRFCCGAPYFRSPWIRYGNDVFFIRRGLKVDLGKRIPGDYSQQGNHLVVQCRDGLAHLEIQI